MRVDEACPVGDLHFELSPQHRAGRIVGGDVELGQALAHARRRHHGRDRMLELGADRRRDALGAEHAVPEAQVHVGRLDAGLLERGHIGQCGRALLAGDQQRLDQPALDERLGHRHCRHVHLDVAGDDVAHGLAAALVGHMHGVDVGAVADHLPGQVCDAADPRGGIVELLRCGARERDQLRHGVGLHVLGDRERERRERDRGDGVVLLQRIERRLLEQPLADAERILRHQQRVAVGIGTGDVVPGEIAVGARPVLDDDRCAQHLLEAVSYTHLDVYKRQDLFYVAASRPAQMTTG